MMDPDIFTMLVTLAERELDHADHAKSQVLEKALIWLQEEKECH